MKPKGHFAFTIEIWDDIGDEIIKEVPGIDDFNWACAIYEEAVKRWPAAGIMLRQGIRVVRDTGASAMRRGRPGARPGRGCGDQSNFWPHWPFRNLLSVQEAGYATPTMFCRRFRLCFAVWSVGRCRPNAPRGQQKTKTTSVDLRPEIEGVAGLQLRLRVTQDRSGRSHRIAQPQGSAFSGLFMQGTDTVIREDGSSQTLRCIGTANDGDDAVILVTADIFQGAKLAFLSRRASRA
jgi:hypothetical protein